MCVFVCNVKMLVIVFDFWFTYNAKTFSNVFLFCLFFLRVGVFERTDKGYLYIFSFYFYLRRVWAISNLWIWYATTLQVVFFRQRWTVMAYLNESMWNLAFQPLKIFYLHYHITYDHQTWEGIDLPWRTQNDKVTWSFNHVVLRDHVTN